MSFVAARKQIRRKRLFVRISNSTAAVNWHVSEEFSRVRLSFFFFIIVLPSPSVIRLTHLPNNRVNRHRRANSVYETILFKTLKYARWEMSKLFILKHFLKTEAVLQKIKAF